MSKQLRQIDIGEVIAVPISRASTLLAQSHAQQFHKGKLFEVAPAETAEFALRRVR